jgi:hypothetical protein
MSIRPPQAVPVTARTNAVELTSTRSDFLTSLAEKKKANSRDGMEKVVATYIARDESFIATKRRVYAKFVAFHEVVHGLEERGFVRNARDALARTLGPRLPRLSRAANSGSCSQISLTASSPPRLISPSAQT